MSVKFTSVRVVPHFEQAPDGGFDVYWSITGQTYSPTFQVSIAPTESGPWTALLSPKTSAFSALNLDTQKLNTQPALTWFKVGVYNGSTLDAESTPMDSRNGMDRRNYLRYREMLRRWRLTFDKTPCTPGWLLRRKFYGEACPNCSDEILKTPVNSDCGVCYGTGITGGYYTPIAMRGDWSKGTVPRTINTTVKDKPGPEQVQRSVLKIFGVPDAKSEDVWVDQGTMLRWLVESVEPEQWYGSVVTQALTLSRLPAHHPSYRFPVS